MCPPNRGTNSSVEWQSYCKGADQGLLSCPSATEESFCPPPFTADPLFSSIHVSGDLLISVGKEVNTIGGQYLFECRKYKARHLEPGLRLVHVVDFQQICIYLHYSATFCCTFAVYSSHSLKCQSRFPTFAAVGVNRWVTAFIFVTTGHVGSVFCRHITLQTLLHFPSEMHSLS